MSGNLQAELDQRREQWQANAAPERRKLYEAQIEELRASGLIERSLQIGTSAPDFSLPDARGGTFILRNALARGPVVAVFYRGGWCPYCNITLRAYQRALAEIRAAGAEFVAISPERPDHGLSTAEKNDLAFPVLSDTDNRVANSFGLVFELPAELAQAYAANGINLSKINAVGEWHLPAPATFVIARSGRVALAHVEVDYRRRLDPDDGGPGGKPITITESAAIMLYLAEKCGRLIPEDPLLRVRCFEWLFFHAAGLGPAFGQSGYFQKLAPEAIPIAINRFHGEAKRSLKVLDSRLAETEYMAGEYSIADIAHFGWIWRCEFAGVDFADAPNVARWYATIEAREAVQRAIGALSF